MIPLDNESLVAYWKLDLYEDPEYDYGYEIGQVERIDDDKYVLINKIFDVPFLTSDCDYTFLKEDRVTIRKYSEIRDLVDAVAEIHALHANYTAEMDKLRRAVSTQHAKITAKNGR